ncbi:MAG: hypothetical protein US69_C0023G0005 [candidate division TM6 bacterium GW2011_GWF2_38_10]|nr:MAG: hypothetical protein US69_C0023G0005 [candidate division TM6 bacterium GW2011_GWF2_38_10]
MDSRSRGLAARAENDNRRLARHPWGRGFSPQPEDPFINNSQKIRIATQKTLQAVIPQQQYDYTTTKEHIFIIFSEFFKKVIITNKAFLDLPKKQFQNNLLLTNQNS